MSKKNKFGKVIAVTAIIGTATAAIVAYLHKSGSLKVGNDIDDDEFLDEDFEFPEDEENASREYITINKSEEADSNSENSTDTISTESISE